MNNKSLVNLKFAWEVPGLGTFRIEAMSELRPDILKPLGWHTYSRCMARADVMAVRAVSQFNDPGLAYRASFFEAFRNRHNVPKGWHI